MAALEATKIIAVIGAGTMGAGIAQVAAAAGYSVLLYDQADGAAKQGIDKTAQGLNKLVERGRISAEDQQAIIGRMSCAASLDDLAPAALIIEAIVENLDIKQAVFKQLETICDQQTIFASNTSSLSITSIASALEHPERLLGMHFFNPAPIMKLVEVVSGLVTDKQIAATVYATAKNWGKRPVHAQSTPGFIVNRVARSFYAEALRLLQEGAADVATIDAIMRESGGFRMGPFELMDLIGHDVNYAVTSSVHQAYYGDQRFTPSLLQKELVDARFLGVKTERGFYDYRKNASKPQPSTCAAKATPSSVMIAGESSVSPVLYQLINAAGIKISREASGHFSINTAKATISLSDGRMATVRALEENISNLVLFDLAFDYVSATRITLSAADTAEPEAIDEAIGFFQALGKQVSLIDDVAGLCVLRTVCMLANEGADTVNQQVCSVADVNVAMQAGLNYPKGPLAWADEIGLQLVITVLDNLVENYGEDRYRASPLLVRRLAAGRHLCE